MQTLQEAGVHAAMVNTMADLFCDRQLVHRRHWRRVLHKEVGVHHAEMPGYELSLTPCNEPLPEPCLCEHTEMVLHRLLGLSGDAVELLAKEGAVELSDNSVAVEPP